LLRVDSRKVASPQQLLNPSRPGTTQRAVTICDEASGASGICNLGPCFARGKWVKKIFFGSRATLKNRRPEEMQHLGRSGVASDSTFE
jgi:hypothetical protein